MRAENRPLVLTNGCFDLLHVGHVRYLAQARGLGEALVVAINSDESVRRLKGPRRPLTPDIERAEMLAALESVDFVIVFDEDTASALVEEIEPAIYVKGGDYSSDPSDPRFPVEGNSVKKYGGSVVTVEYVPGHSTTAMLDKVTRETTPQE
jgi:rfaE bifunctional protein nucleotidyltransferase chain/domain